MRYAKMMVGAAMLVSGGAHAGGFGYSQVGLSLVNGSDDAGGDYDGHEINVAFDLNRVVIGLRVQTLEQDTAGGTIKGMLYTGGIGSYLSLSPDVDLHGSIYGGQYDVDAPSAKLADTSVLIGTIGLRWRLNPQFEGDVYAASYQYDKDVENDTSIGATLEYRLAPSGWRLKVGYESLKNADQWSLGVVFRW